MQHLPGLQLYPNLPPPSLQHHHILRIPRDTLPAQPEYHVRVTRPKHRVPRPPPTSSLTYIPGLLVRAPEFEPLICVCVRTKRPTYEKLGSACDSRVVLPRGVQAV
jgi:hypothetical protein